MICPLRSTSLGSSARVSATRPVTLVSMTSSIRSQSVSGSGSVGGARPALLSSRSMSPHGGDSLREAFDGFAVAHVDLEREERVAKLVLKLAQPLARRPVPMTLPAAATNLARGRVAEARRSRR